MIAIAMLLEREALSRFEAGEQHQVVGHYCSLDICLEVVEPTPRGRRAAALLPESLPLGNQLVKCFGFLCASAAIGDSECDRFLKAIRALIIEVCANQATPS